MKHQVTYLLTSEGIPRRLINTHLCLFCRAQLEDNLEREKKQRADVEKAKRKLEQDLKATQANVEDLERVKRELEENVRR